MLAHILDEYGIALPDMQASTLERRIADPDLPDVLRELLLVRLQASTTSVSKYKSLIKGVSADGRLRGTLQFDGAQRTGRWAGRLFQPQNLFRPDMEADEIDIGIEAIKADCADLAYDNPTRVAANAIRGAIIAPPGKKLVVSDLSNIEGRVVAWLAGEEWKLQAFRDFDAGIGPDLYKLAYGKSFAIDPEDVTKSQRQIGKVEELMLGYQGGVGAFITGAATYGIDLDELAAAAFPSIPDDVLAEAMAFYNWTLEKKRPTFGLEYRTFIVCDSIKRMWRRAHPKIEELWGELEAAFRSAVVFPGVAFPCHGLTLRKDGAWVRIILPSGRALCYPSPQIDDKSKLTYKGINQYSHQWQRLKTYGGKLVENVTQAVARDVMAHNMPVIEGCGYEIVLTVHDEVITEAPDAYVWNARGLSGLLAEVPPWGEGLPLAAGGFEAQRYRKD
jgi:DNA polymerase bacteriophage-type